MAEKKRLGRGLSALIGERSVAPGAAAADVGQPTPEAGTATAGRLRDLPLGDIGPASRQPRRAFDEEELAELAESIRNLGLLQPVVVRPAATQEGPAWELIAGERRWRAAKLAGVDTIPALVRSADEAAALEMALAENVAREDLNAIEEAHAYAALADEFGLTHERIGELVGRSRVAVTNVLRLLELPDDVQTMVEGGQLSEGHARALLGVADHGARRTLARRIVADGLTVRRTEALVRKLAEAASGGGAAAPPPRPTPDAAYDDLVDELYGLLEVPVRIRAGRRGGRIELRFRDRAEFERLLALLRSLR